jgi:ring-1,2-phenylacetyl-CoA epoxidase subunit PaaE
MNKIQQLSGTITKIRDLSPTAREYTITPEQPFPFIAGAFVNIFIEHEGKTIRRAFSMSSSDEDSGSFTVSIRLSLNGELTPVLWSKNFLGEKVKIMGPLGLNTADKLTSDKVYLFGFGVGAGVVKSLAEHLSKQENLTSLTIMTGNRTVEEILHKDYFDELAKTNKKVSVQYIVSDKDQNLYPIGYIQEHVTQCDFNNTDVYMCGQGVACQALESAIKATSPQNCNLLIEDFH